MDRIERLRTFDPNSPPDDLSYDEVRQSFLIRLQRERTDLVVRLKALTSAAQAPEAAYRNLEEFAHRLRGAAAVFAFSELQESAKVLEFAAKAALHEKAPADDLRVRGAARELHSQLTRSIGDAQ